MSEVDLRSIIEQVLAEMTAKGMVNPQSAEPAAAPAATTVPQSATTWKPEPKASQGLAITAKGIVLEAPVIEDGCLEDITQIDTRTQYLVENAENREAYADLKQNSPSRLGIGKAGARYRTLPQLEFRAAHSAAQDAVFSDVDEDFIESQGLFIVQSACDSKDTYLTRPDLGRTLSAEARETIKARCKKNPSVQIFVADGLSSAAMKANIPDILPAMTQGLGSYGIDVGTPFFVKYGRVAIMDEISELTGAEVTCVLIGERPGLITATSMSAYLSYRATVGMGDARRTVLSNIHADGTIPAEAGAHLAEIIKIMLEAKASGVDLKL